MSHIFEIQLLGANLSAGETLRTICPTCGGGSSGEKSFSLTREETGNLVWYCFRASCPAKGHTGPSNITAISQQPKREKPRAQFTGKTEPLSNKLIERIHTMWGIKDPENWYWTKEYGGRIAMSVRSPKYMHRGWILRDIWGTSRTKVLTYINENEEGLSWYKTTPNAGTLLVEDIPSAVRASQYINACALLGTGIGMNRALEIANYAPRPIVLALDQDATADSFKWAKKYSLLWEDVMILPLTKDIKNQTEDELWNLLSSNSLCSSPR